MPREHTAICHPEVVYTQHDGVANAVGLCGTIGKTGAGCTAAMVMICSRGCSMSSGSCLTLRYRLMMMNTEVAEETAVSHVAPTRLLPDLLQSYKRKLPPHAYLAALQTSERAYRSCTWHTARTQHEAATRAYRPCGKRTKQKGPHLHQMLLHVTSTPGARCFART